MSSGFDLSSQPPDAIAAPRRPTAGELFTGFLEIGLYGFGGLAAIARHVLVEKRKWLNEQDYAALFGLCQALPGGNVINVATILGDRFAGLKGACAAVCGLFAMPLLLLVIIAGGFELIAHHPDVQAAATGAAAAAAGLVIGTAYKMGRVLRLSAVALAFAAMGFVAIAVFRFPLIRTLLVLLPLCVAATFWERRR